MLEYAKESHIQNKKDLDEKLQLLKGDLFTLRRLAKTLRSDLYAVNENLSESLVYKKITLQAKIDQLESLSKYIEDQKETFINLSNDWKTYLQSKEELPKIKFQKVIIRKSNYCVNILYLI